MVRKMAVVMAVVALTLIFSAGLYAQGKGGEHRGRGPSGRGGGGNPDWQRMKDYAQKQGMTPEKWQNMTPDEREQFKQQMQQQGGGNGDCPQCPPGGKGNWKDKMDDYAQKNGFKDADDMKSHVQSMSPDERDTFIQKMKNQMGQNGDASQGNNSPPPPDMRDKMQNFLQQNGLTPDDVKNMSDDQRQQLFEKFKSQQGQNGDNQQRCPPGNNDMQSKMQNFMKQNGITPEDWQNMSQDQREQLKHEFTQQNGIQPPPPPPDKGGDVPKQYQQQFQQIKSHEDALKDQMKKVMSQEEQLQNQWKNMSPDEREQNKSQMEAQHQQIESQRQNIMQQFQQLQAQKQQLKADCEKCEKDKLKQTNKGDSQNQGRNRNSGNNGGWSPKTTNDQDNEITPEDIMDK